MGKSLGIIGCGAVIKNNYISSLGKFHDIDVNHVFDINTNLANEIAVIFNASSSSKNDLIKNSEIIVIATPPSTHSSLIKESIAEGKRIICEKPFVGTVKEANELIDLSKKGNAELFVAHFRRCYPSVLLAKSIINSGVMGKVVGIEAYEGGKFSWKTESGYIYKDPYGGVLFDTGSHTIDMALFMTGLDRSKITPEIVSIKKDKEEPAHEVDAKLNLQTNDQTIDFRVKLSRRLLLANKIRITCVNGYIDVPTEMQSYIRLWGKNSSTILYSNVKYDSLLDCFAMQFNEMFYGRTDSIFTADRFINLTYILETIANN